MKRSVIVVLIVIAAVAAMVWSGFIEYRARKVIHARPAAAAALQQGDAPGSATAKEAVDQNSPAAQGLPDLRYKTAPGFTLKSLDGKTVSLSDYKGKAVLLNFWATWCGPCKVEMPWLIDLQKKYASQGFTVIGISEDDGPVENVREFVQRIGVNYPVLMYDDKLNKAYGGIDFLPTSYYIARDGKVLLEVGGLVSESEIETNIQKILAKGA